MLTVSQVGGPTAQAVGDLICFIEFSDSQINIYNNAQQTENRAPGILGQQS